MGIRNWISNLRGKAQDDGPGWNALIGTSEPWKPADAIWDTFTAEQKEKVYKLSDIIFACVREIATTAGEPSLEIGRYENTAFKAVDHPMLDKFYNPNPFYDSSKFVYYIVARMLLTGESYVLKLRNGLSKIGELWPMPTHRMTLKTGKENILIDHFELAQKGKAPIKIPTNDVMYSYFPDPHNTIRGIGPLEAGIHRYQMDKEGEDYIIEMIKNMKVPSVKVTTQKPLTADQRKDLREALHDRAGKGARGGVIVADGGVNVESWVPLRDLDWPGLFSMNETRICSAFGVPPILIGLRAGLDRSTYANYEEARRSFYAETMRPLWISLQSAFTKSLLTSEGEETLEFKFKLEEVAGLQEDANRRTERAARIVQGGFGTVNEARELSGLPPVKGGNIYLRSPLLSEIPADGSGMEED